MTQPDPCPCGSGRAFTACCGPYLAGTALPETAEALMRSRYTAYARRDGAYLSATWHPTTRRVDLGLDGKFAWFSVTDHGIGIPPEELPFIFERFRRVEKGAAATISGTGLGLAIVKLLVEMHGGRIVARSELKAGSTFTIYLPIRGE